MSRERTQHAALEKWTIRSKESNQPRTRASVPDDPSLPGLALLRHPQTFAEVLTPLLKGRFGNDMRLEETRHSVRRHVPGKRCIVKLEVRLRSAPGAPVEQHRLLAKCYATGHGAKVYENCQQLWRRGFSIGDLRITEPIVYHSRWQVLFLGWESGRTLRDFLIAGVDVDRAVEGAALWLLKLHACRYREGRIYSYQRHFHTLGVWERNLIHAHREMGAVFGSIRIAIKNQLAKCKKGKRAPTHRDFSPEHLIVEDDRFVGLDFDEFCQYDPLFDVAHFIAHLRFLALTSCGAIDYLDPHAARFESAYASGSSNFSLPRLRLLTAIAFLKLAYLEAAVRRVKNGKRIAFKLLDEAHRFASF
jgi:hypothetical protein